MSSSSYWMVPFQFASTKSCPYDISLLSIWRPFFPSRLQLMCLSSQVNIIRLGPLVVLQFKYVCYSKSAGDKRCAHNPRRLWAAVCAQNSQFSLTCWVSRWHLCGVYTPCVGWRHLKKASAITSIFLLSCCSSSGSLRPRVSMLACRIVSRQMNARWSEKSTD